MNRVYISGPVTGTNDYLFRFSNAGKELEEKGYTVINPPRYNEQLPKNLSHDEVMHVCLALLDLCDSIYMLDGWEESKGASEEFAYAKEKGKKILYPEKSGGDFGQCFKEVEQAYREYSKKRDSFVLKPFDPDEEAKIKSEQETKAILFSSIYMAFLKAPKALSCYAEYLAADVCGIYESLEPAGQKFSEGYWIDLCKTEDSIFPEELSGHIFLPTSENKYIVVGVDIY